MVVVVFHCPEIFTDESTQGINLAVEYKGRNGSNFLSNAQQLWPQNKRMLLLKLDKLSEMSPSGQLSRRDGPKMDGKRLFILELLFK